ncbi:HWE histidine kinase domain-containing protein [Erythrobacteraceae bacterium WH01K]|nr:HWE histidine kinase domain-containing protein [Erythrobacteraceae bacterium WH01K]
MIQRYPKVDLTNCDREPIHLIGCIQPFGALLAFADDWTVSNASANAGEMLGKDGPVALGTPLRQVMTEEVFARLRTMSASISGDIVERIFGVDLTGNGKLFDVAVHDSASTIVVEFEPHSDNDVSGPSSLRPLLSRFEKKAKLQDLLEEGTRQVRDILGYDRVMLYRFHPDGSGEVVAEERHSQVDSFLGLRYPTSDIPQQARALMVRNRFRVIADMEAEEVPVLPERSVDGAVLDLSMSVLRAHSKMHVEYMRNMNVRASLTISLVIDGQLWGMFSCHHMTPRLPGFDQRTMAELFSELFSLSVERLLNAEARGVQTLGDDLRQRLLRSVADGGNLSEQLFALRQPINKAIPHDGIAYFVDGEYRLEGYGPNEEEFRAILPALNASNGGRVVVSENLSGTLPEAAGFARKAAGALMLPISRTPRDYFILWRRPLPQVVTWAGNPEKVLIEEEKGLRISPRKSFAAWQETVANRSADFSDSEIRLAESLRVALLEVVLKMTDEVAVERKKAQEKHELLIAELNHRVRNILNLIRGLVNQSSRETRDGKELAELIGGRIGALASAHDNITRENWSPASLTGLIENEAEAYLGAKRSRFSVVGEDMYVTPEAYTVIALVIHEMTTNSAKYGSLSDGTGTLTVTLTRNAAAGLEIEWREAGGPEVREPKRQGFGSTIIHRSIPHELNGEADITYDPAGVVARFVIPATHLREVPDDAPDRTGAAPTVEPGSVVQEASQDTPGDVLLVEDSLIIALDVEGLLGDLGVAKVRVASSVDQALAMLDEKKPDWAILDFNLGETTSEPVAEKLAASGVPFVLATGYGEMADRYGETGASGVLQKPYGKDELEKALADYRP